LFLGWVLDDYWDDVLVVGDGLCLEFVWCWGDEVGDDEYEVVDWDGVLDGVEK